MKQKDLGERIQSWYDSYDTHPTWSSILGFTVRENKKVRNQTIKEVKDLIIKEIVIAQKEGQPTSRLTSLYNKL